MTDPSKPLKENDKHTYTGLHLLIKSGKVNVDISVLLSDSIAFENLISVGILLFCLHVICTVGKQ